MKKATTLLLFVIVLTVPSFCVAQHIYNMEIRADFNHVCNWDFDLNRQTSPDITKNVSYLIEVNSEGTGRVVFLDDQYGTKYIYKIKFAKYDSYSNGESFILIETSKDNQDFEFRINYVFKRNKMLITKIAEIKEATNAGNLSF